MNKQEVATILCEYIFFVLPVKWNCKKISDAGRAGHDVGGDPELAEVPTEAPRPGDVVDQCDRHDHGGNKEICAMKYG